jgi:hypothetical protein
MVFEQLFKVKWIERKEHAFFLGFVYSIIGLVSARFIFPSGFGLMSIAFTSILLIPSLAMLLKMEENVEIREKKLSLKLLFKDHKDIFKVYTFMFLGVFLAYSLIALLFPQLTIQKLFEAQLRAAGVRGFATFSGTLFSIVLNNLIVFVVCFILSLMYGAGAVLFLVWNASVWGVVFVYFIKEASAVIGMNPFVEFGSSILPFLPHMVTEAAAYVGAAITGGVVSKAVLREKLFSREFHHIITDALIFLALGIILVLIAGIIEINYAANI